MNRQEAARKTLHWWKYQKPITGEKEGKMTREEAAKKWEWVVENFNDSAIYLWPDERQKLIESISLLRNPIPDPITGLVPCGCGGEAEFVNTDDPKFKVAVVCSKCFTRTDDIVDKQSASETWNMAMGE